MIRQQNLSIGLYAVADLTGYLHLYRLCNQPGNPPAGNFFYTSLRKTFFVRTPPTRTFSIHVTESDAFARHPLIDSGYPGRLAAVRLPAAPPAPPRHHDAGPGLQHDGRWRGAGGRRRLLGRPPRLLVPSPHWGRGRRPRDAHRPENGRKAGYGAAG